MKLFLAQILFLISLNTYCQSGQVIGHITKTDTLLEYNYLTVLLTRDSLTIKGTVPDTTGLFHFDKISEGIYKLVVHQIGYRDFVTDSLQIFNDTTVRINLTYPPPCIFVYLTRQKPKCSGGHLDHIIPIVYGLPTKKTMEKAKKGLVHISGCTVTDCDPHYYCTVHNIEL